MLVDVLQLFNLSKKEGVVSGGELPDDSAVSGGEAFGPHAVAAGLGGSEAFGPHAVATGLGGSSPTDESQATFPFKIK